MWINSFDDSYSLTGSLVIGEFLDPKTSSSCTLYHPSTPKYVKDITVLLIRFDEALTNYGCSSYADVIQRNEWLQHNFTTQTTSETTNETNDSLSNLPMVIIFTSMNDGDPGIREKYYGNVDILSKSESKLALIRVSDAKEISYLKPKTSFINFTSDSGPWINLLKSKDWKIWSILFGIFYSSMIILAFSSFILAINQYKFDLTNLRLWLFIAILSYSFILLVIFEYDPWSIRYNYLSELNYEIIVMTAYYILCLCYAIFLFPWIKATRNLTEVVNYNIGFVRKLSRIFQCGTGLAILIKTTSIIFYLLQFSPNGIKISLMILRVIFTILESLFCLIIICTFGTFGVIIFFARIHEQKTRRRRSREHQPVSRKSVRKEIFLSGILTIIIIISLIFVTLQEVIMIYLPITIESFWIIRITNDVSNIFSGLVLIIGLYSNTIGKYSHMMYSGSSDENITTSTFSGDSSNNPNVITSINDDIITTTNVRNKRTTIEILFGRNSLGL
ncbi:hypothetical protein C1645_874958 [Glomus cerebriforme]|uniref:Lung seven transmembrane receptor-domain-containing protein n=1 Tax=Glomus cerebriforme TaxID=658196 RepID=A0A397T5H1_9GLOM|nr:hypothetical protein C1645_874958 [Glomus cerebriforme]